MLITWLKAAPAPETHRCPRSQSNATRTLMWHLWHLSECSRPHREAGASVGHLVPRRENSLGSAAGAPLGGCEVVRPPTAIQRMADPFPHNTRCKRDEGGDWGCCSEWRMWRALSASSTSSKSNHDRKLLRRGPPRYPHQPDQKKATYTSRKRKLIRQKCFVKK